MRRKQPVFWVMLVGIIFGFESFAFSQTTLIPSGTQGQFEELTLTLEIPKDKVFPLEPLVFTMKLKNNTPKPIKAMVCLRPMCNHHIEVHVAKPGEKMTLIDPLDWDSKGVIPPRPQVIAPGEERQARWTYFAGLNEYFPEPGVFHLKAIYWNASGAYRVESKKVVLHVMEPLGVEKLALEYVRDKHPGNPTRFWYASDWEELVLLYPGTAYARHAGYIAGMRAKRKKNWGKAVEYLTAPAEHPDFPLADEVLNILNSYHGNRNPEKARAYQQLLNTRFPHSKYADKE